MEILKQTFEMLSAIANIFTILISVLTFYVFITNKEKIINAFDLLINFSFQTTLSELKEKLHRINEYDASVPAEAVEIRNILHEISGQIKGNSVLLKSLPKLLNSIENISKNKKLSEAIKRSIVSEIREELKNIQVRSTIKYERKS